MADAGFFRGTNSEQDTRFSDKQKKLLKTMKFSDVLSEKVDMKKVKLDSIKPWIATKITELLNLEDEVVVEYVFTQLEAPVVDPKMMQINLTGFLNGKNAREFMRELWEYLLSAQASPFGIPDKFLEAKKVEMRERELEQGRVSAAIKKTKDSIDQLSGPAKKEVPAIPPKVSAVPDGRDDRRSSPFRQRRSPARNRFNSPPRNRRSPSPRRPNVRRSGSREDRRSPYNRRFSPPPRRPIRRSRSRSDSRSPKRFKDRNSPVARRSPMQRVDVSKPVRRSSSSSPSPTPNRRPIPRRKSKSPGRHSRSSSSSSASSRGGKKKPLSSLPAVNKPVAVVAAVPRPISGKSDQSEPTRRPSASNERLTNTRNRDRSRSRSDSPPVRRARNARSSESPDPRRGKNNRSSPPRYRKRSESPRRGPRDRSESPRTRNRKHSSSPEAEQSNGTRPSDAARNRNGRPGQSYSTSQNKQGEGRQRADMDPRGRSIERASGKDSLGPEKGMSKPSTLSPKIVSKGSDHESVDGESPKKPKKAKKDKKHKKHKKHRKEKSSKRKDNSSDEETMNKEEKLRLRALESMRKTSADM